MIFNTKFVLASTSKSRYFMLKNTGLHFIKYQPLCDESKLKKELLIKKTTPKKISLELARLKAFSVSKKIKNKIIVGSDTVISIGIKILPLFLSPSMEAGSPFPAYVVTSPFVSIFRIKLNIL